MKIESPLRSAVTQAEREIKALRACVNIIGVRGFHLESNASWSPSYEFTAPPFLLRLDGRGRYASFYFDQAALFYQRFYKAKALSAAHFEKSLDLLASVRSLSEPVREAVLRPLVFFQDSLDTPFRQLALLAMWRALETLPYQDAEQSIQYEELVRVAGSIFGSGTEKAQSVCAILESLRRKRNDFVHLADDQGIDDLDCSWLRLLLKQVLLWLVTVADGVHDVRTLREVVKRYGAMPRDLDWADEQALRVLSASEVIRGIRGVNATRQGD